MKYQLHETSEALKYLSNINNNLVILDVWLDNSDLDGIGILKKFERQNLIS